MYVEIKMILQVRGSSEDSQQIQEIIFSQFDRITGNFQSEKVINRIMNSTIGQLSGHQSAWVSVVETTMRIGIHMRLFRMRSDNEKMYI